MKPLSEAVGSDKSKAQVVLACQTRPQDLQRLEQLGCLLGISDWFSSSLLHKMEFPQEYCVTEVLPKDEDLFGSATDEEEEESEQVYFYVVIFKLLDLGENYTIHKACKKSQNNSFHEAFYLLDLKIYEIIIKMKMYSLAYTEFKINQDRNHNTQLYKIMYEQEAADRSENESYSHKL